MASTPIFIVLLGRALGGEKLGWTRTAGIFIAAFGVILVVSQGDLQALSIGRFGAPGDRLMLLSAPNWAVFSILSRRGLRDHPVARMMFFVMLLGWLLTSALLFSRAGLHTLPHLSISGWWSLLFLGVLASGFAYIAWYDALQKMQASQLRAYLYLEPLVPVIIAWIVLSERFTTYSILGGCLILLGIYRVNRQPR